MEYDRGDSFPFDFEPNGIPFGSKSKGKLSLRSYPIQCERKWKHNFLSAAAGLIKYLDNLILYQISENYIEKLIEEHVSSFGINVQLIFFL